MTTTATNLTASEKILMAARRLEKLGKTPFTAEALVVESWVGDHVAFGLKGYVDVHPDSNRILSALMGKRGLIARAWLIKVGPKMYRMGKAGRVVVDCIHCRTTVAPHVAKVEPCVAASTERDDQLIWLLAILSTDAAVHSLDRLDFVKAREFWNLSVLTTGAAVDQRLADLEKQLLVMAQTLEQGGIALPDGRWVEKDEVTALLRRHSELKLLFSRQLNIMRGKR